jgi:hypothetical protein
MIYLQNSVIDHLKYSISLGWGSSKGTGIVHRYGHLFQGALFKARPDRQDTNLKLQKQVTSCY